ncbi:hypothetical protein MBLNU457_7259t1 [Dothideomycetes sp. NU457]
MADRPPVVLTAYENRHHNILRALGSNRDLVETNHDIGKVFQYIEDHQAEFEALHAQNAQNEKIEQGVADIEAIKNDVTNQPSFRDGNIRLLNQKLGSQLRVLQKETYQRDLERQKQSFLVFSKNLQKQNNDLKKHIQQKQIQTANATRAAEKAAEEKKEQHRKEG